jgi:hypothetical protein
MCKISVCVQHATPAITFVFLESMAPWHHNVPFVAFCLLERHLHSFGRMSALLDTLAALATKCVHAWKTIIMK